MGRYSPTHFPDGSHSQTWSPPPTPWAVPLQALQGHLQPFLGVTPGGEEALCSGVGWSPSLGLHCSQSPEAPDATGLLVRGPRALRWEVRCVSGCRPRACSCHRTGWTAGSTTAVTDLCSQDHGGRRGQVEVSGSSCPLPATTDALACVARVGVTPQSKGSLVQFPVRAPAWGVGLVPT